MRRAWSGVVAGALGAVAWTVADAVLRPTLRTTYSDTAVLERTFAAVGLPRPAPLASAAHLGMCVLAGGALTLVPPRRRVVVSVPALQAELLAVWPVVRRLRAGVGGFDAGRRAFAEAAATRAVFALVAAGASTALRVHGGSS